MLTRKQAELLKFIAERIDSTGVSQSFEEMCQAVNVRSKSNISWLINALEKRGFIRRMPHRARSLEVLRLPDALGDGPDARDELLKQMAEALRVAETAEQHRRRYGAGPRFYELYAPVDRLREEALAAYDGMVGKEKVT